MKKLIKELCKREGKKKQVAVGDMREIMARLADIIVDGARDVSPNRELGIEFVNYLEKIASKRNKRVTFVKLDFKVTSAFINTTKKKKVSK